MRMTYKQIGDLVEKLDDATLEKLIAHASAESRQRFEHRCGLAGKSLVTTMAHSRCRNRECVVCRPENREGGER